MGRSKRVSSSSVRVSAVRWARAGLSLVEIVVAMSVLMIAAMGFVQSMGSSAKLSGSSRERGLAIEAARDKLEEIQDQVFQDVFRLYDANPDNDPGGVGTAPGASFVVEGLSAMPDDPDGLVGEVVFPTVGFELIEDVERQELGMPRDLNGDDDIDGVDHSGDYLILPVIVRVEWRGFAGGERFQLRTILGER